MALCSEIYVCHDCIGEVYLSQQVYTDDNLEECCFCGENTTPVISIDELGDLIHEVIENYYQQTSAEPDGYEYALLKDGFDWDRSGQEVDYLIADLAGVDESITELLHSYLSSTHDASGKDSLYEEQPYDSEAHYTEKTVETYGLVESWLDFKYNLQHQIRYLNQHAVGVLDAIFKNLTNLTTRDGDSVIYELAVGETASPLYRARFASSKDDLKVVLEGLPGTLGAPPPLAAKSGRMNASGISVFYGAMDVDTCLAEIRAPVGSSVVVGTFYPARSLKVVDLSMLQKLDCQGSLFDPNHNFEVSRAVFLRNLIHELNAPVLPGSEEREYLPTQVVTEYLAQLDGLVLDGVVFDSSQASDEGKNVVLFNHASVVSPYELPEGTDVSVSFDCNDPDEYDQTITVWERLPNEEAKKKESKRFVPRMPYEYDFWNPSHREPMHEPSLRLDLASVKVHKVKGVSYTCKIVDVNRHKTDKR